MALLSSASASLASPRAPRATVPRPRIGTLTPVLPSTRWGSLSLGGSPQEGRALPSSTAAPTAPARTKSRREKSAVMGVAPFGRKMRHPRSSFPPPPGTEYPHGPLTASKNFRESHENPATSFAVAERHAAGTDVGLPLVQQRPAGRAGAEVGHVLVLRQPVDGLLNDAVVTAKDGAVAGQQE